jgi:transcriptional regulator of arginine metabolism
VTQKRERQDLILKFIGKEPISRQDVLAAKLGRAGHAVTQASISRDLDELGISKVEGIYVRARISPTVDLAIQSISIAGPNLIIVRCDPGMASAVTVRIDRSEIAEVIGTIAGDDTIFIAVADDQSQSSAIDKIKSLFGKYQ